jgi:hypothetical protein
MKRAIALEISAFAGGGGDAKFMARKDSSFWYIRRLHIHGCQMTAEIFNIDFCLRPDSKAAAEGRGRHF